MTAQPSWYNNSYKRPGPPGNSARAAAPVLMCPGRYSFLRPSPPPPALLAFVGRPATPSESEVEHMRLIITLTIGSRSILLVFKTETATLPSDGFYYITEIRTDELTAGKEV